RRVGRVGSPPQSMTSTGPGRIRVGERGPAVDDPWVVRYDGWPVGAGTRGNDDVLEVLTDVTADVEGGEDQHDDREAVVGEAELAHELHRGQERRQGAGHEERRGVAARHVVVRAGLHAATDEGTDDEVENEAPDDPGSEHQSSSSREP